jgi:RimJ/RimL family protein N-acetyltransferase
MRTEASGDAAIESSSGSAGSSLQDPLGREGRLVRLREATMEDAPLVDARNADAAMAGEFNDLGQPPPKPLAEQLANGKRTVSPERGRLLVERIDDGAVIGEVSWHTVMYGPNEQSRALNIGAALYPDARGRGFGTEAQRLLAELLLEHVAVERVEASTDVDNIAEQRSLDKAGFTREGVIRRAQFRAGGYHDLVNYSFVRDDLERRR